MYGESPCTGNLIGDIWVTVTASTSRQEGREGRVWWAQRRWADDLLFIDALRDSEAGTPGRVTLCFAMKMIPRQSCKQNTICSWQSLRVPSLYEHMGMPQQQLLMRAWNTAHFSNSLLNFIFLFLGVFCFYRERMKWWCVFSTPKSVSFHYFKLEESWFRLDIKNTIQLHLYIVLYNEGGKILAQRGGGSI